MNRRLKTILPDLMNKKILIAILVLAALSLIYYLMMRPKPVAVEVVRIEPGEVKSTVSNTRVGTVKACRRALLAPATGGEVARIHVKEGDTVKQNQLLMEVWNKDLKAQLELQDAQIRPTKPPQNKSASSRAAPNARPGAFPCCSSTTRSSPKSRSIPR